MTRDDLTPPLRTLFVTRSRGETLSVGLDRLGDPSRARAKVADVASQNWTPSGSGSRPNGPAMRSTIGIVTT